MRDPVHRQLSAKTFDGVPGFRFWRRMCAVEGGVSSREKQIPAVSGVSRSLCVRSLSDQRLIDSGMGSRLHPPFCLRSPQIGF